MKRTMTRRAVGRLMAAAPVALALPASAPGQVAPKQAARSAALSARQRRDLEKAVKPLDAAASAVRGMTVPIGTEPAFTFRPVRVGK